jgi:hypothetical protein
MAISLTISTKELERQAIAAFQGKTYKVFLALNTTSLTAESTTAAWEAIECSGGGYAAVTGTLAAGSYNAGNARYQMPVITASFTGSGAGISYNTVCLKIGSELYLHSITTENPSVLLAAGQSKVYSITLAQDD